jgi:hypothetical protein
MQGTLTNGNQWRNSFHVWGHDSASPVEVADLEGLLASTWMTDLIAKYVAALADACTLDGVLARQVQHTLNPDDDKNEAFRSVNTAGGVAGTENVPAEVAMLLKIGSDAAGKSSHGRVFLPWRYHSDEILAENFIVGSTAFTTATAIATQLLLLAYNSGSHATGGAVDFDLAIYSHTLRARSADQYGFRVTSARVDRRVHWLRSRGKGS